MLKPVYTMQFEKDIKRAVKRGKDTSKLKSVIVTLVNENNLALRYNDHKLSGIFKFRRECHIEPDWLLIYKIEEEMITFERTGTHSDLFK